ncbi:hypothetical protein NG754_04940 [Aliarcobacter cryaerophilus]|uniref:hypothetical protein n=1 Tax=Aliarcobacter cryaerophilus TaxID=28198 RepID=UPI003DA271DF
MKNINLNDEDMNTLKSMSLLNNDADKYMLLLNKKYGFSLTKEELSFELRVSTQTVDRRIKENMNIPAYQRTGGGKKASYLFPISNVAKHLCTTIIVND